MTVFSANKAVKHLYSLISSVEALHAPLEVSALLPKDGVPGIDYFSIHNPEHLIILRLRVFANLPRGPLRDRGSRLRQALDLNETAAIWNQTDDMLDQCGRT
jgi:hypothetical protein